MSVRACKYFIAARLIPIFARCLPANVIISASIPEQLWTEFQNQSLSVLRQLAPDDERLKEIPPQFYAAFPLDNASKTRGTAGSFGYPSETYKVRRVILVLTLDRGNVMYTDRYNAAIMRNSPWFGTILISEGDLDVCESRCSLRTVQCNPLYRE